MKKLLFNYILYFLSFIILCFIGSSGVFALTYTNIGELRDITQQLVSTNYGSSPFSNPINSGYAFSEVTQVDYIISNYNFVANTNYQLESHLTNQHLDNANYYSVQGLNGESCLISYQNSIFQGAYPRWAFQCPHNTNTITITIKNSSNQYLWSGTGIFNWTTALLKSSDTSLSGGDDSIDSIINNNNQNTQDIINNNNQNTQDIIDSQKVCSYIDKSNININGSYLNISGEIVSYGGYGITDYISIISSTLDVSTVYDTNNVASICYYDTNKELISCELLYNKSTLTIPGNTVYIRSTIRISINKPTFKLCKNGSQALDDTLNDDDVNGATNEASDFFSSFSTNTFGLTSIITAPLNLIQSVLSSTCSDLQLPLPYLNNKYLTLPCMTSIYTQHFGTFFTIYQTITYGIIAYWVCVRIFNQVKDFKNPEHDEIEVMDL